MDKLGIIGGGAMGSAIATGLINKETVAPRDLYLAEPDQNKREELRDKLGITVKAAASELIESCDTLILAVKPQVIQAVFNEVGLKLNSGQLVISIVAGVGLAVLESRMSQARMVRVMPNTPASIGRGISVYSPGKAAFEADCLTVERIFSSVGKVIRVPETAMNAVTAVSGSGPAYVLYFIEAMIDAGVMLGLSRTDATLLVTETFMGTTAMLRESGEHPAKLRNQVTSPGGTTAAALYEFQKGALAGVIMTALKAAAVRSEELGKPRENFK